MADVIHRTTLAYLTSVNTPDYPEPDWKRNPDMSAVASTPRRHWKWDATAERPVPMTQAEADAADAAAIDAGKESRLDAIDALQFEVLFLHENRLRALEGKAAITAATFRAALKARL